MDARTKRFKDSFEESDCSRNGLAKAMQDVRGSSYGSIRNYLAGRSEPPVEFLLAAAEHLGVDANWLAFGTDHPTKEHEEVAGLTAASIEEWGREEAVKLHNGVLQAMDAPSDYHPRHWIGPLAEVRRRLGVDAKRLGRALLGPLDALDIEPGHMSEDDFNDFITAMAPVLLALAPYAPEEEG